MQGESKTPTVQSLIFNFFFRILKYRHKHVQSSSNQHLLWLSVFLQFLFRCHTASKLTGRQAGFLATHFTHTSVLVLGCYIFLLCKFLGYGFLFLWMFFDSTLFSCISSFRLFLELFRHLSWNCVRWCYAADQVACRQASSSTNWFTRPPWLWSYKTTHKLRSFWELHVNS